MQGVSWRWREAVRLSWALSEGQRRKQEGRGNQRWGHVCSQGTLAVTSSLLLSMLGRHTKRFNL